MMDVWQGPKMPLYDYFENFEVKVQEVLADNEMYYVQRQAN